ncbi:unnamed protein product, partial [Ascophyllum nodosum]
MTEILLCFSLLCFDPSWTDPNRCLNAFNIALYQADGKGWYTSTLQLQLASLQFCVLCRSVSTLHVTIKRRIRARVWKDVPTSDGKVKKTRITRVPVLQPLKLTWRLPVSRLGHCSSKVLANVEQLTLGDRNDEIDEVTWPSGLRTLIFGLNFNHSIDGIAWPSSLQKLRFKLSFNQPIDAVTWPESLQQLTFGCKF